MRNKDKNKTRTPISETSPVLDPSVQSLLPSPPSTSRLSIRRFSSSRKKSLKLVEDKLGSISQNDEAEKQARRIMEEESRKKAETEGSQQNRTRDLNENPFRIAVISMTEKELEEHFTDCIRLSNQNKITMKNAFKLHLISVMKRMLDENSKNAENFTLMTYSLDASAKIYSCRVDKLYYDLMKLIKGKDFKRAKEAESSGGSGDEQEEDKKEKKKKKRRSEGTEPSKMLAQPHQIVKGEMEGESFFKDQTSLPNHFEYFLECPISENGETLLNCKLFPSIDEPAESKLVTLENKYEGNVCTIDFSDAIPSYKNLREKFFVTGSTIEEEDVDMAVFYDPSESNLNMPCNDSLNGSKNEYVADYDDPCFDEIEEEPPTEENISEQQNQISNPIPDKRSTGEVSTARKSIGLFSVRRMSKLVSATSNEYSYFDEAKLAFIGEPAHWSIKKHKPRTAKKGGTTRKKAKRNTSLDFEAIKCDGIRNSFENKKRSDILSNKTTSSWSSSNILYEPTGKAKTNCLFRLVSRDVVLVSASKHDSSEPMNIDVDKMTPRHDDDLSSDDDFDRESNTTVISVGARNDFDDSEVLACPLQDSVMEQETSGPTELIPAPPKVEKISIQYAKAPKKIDMKLLKSTIWSNIDFNSDKNVDKAEVAEFSKVYTQLPASLPKEDSNALTPHLSFMALLFLANEKCLDVKSTKNSSELLITKANAPN